MDPIWRGTIFVWVETMSRNPKYVVIVLKSNWLWSLAQLKVAWNIHVWIRSSKIQKHILRYPKHIENNFHNRVVKDCSFRKASYESIFRPYLLSLFPLPCFLCIHDHYLWFDDVELKRKQPKKGVIHSQKYPKYAFDQHLRK